MIGLGPDTKESNIVIMIKAKTWADIMLMADRREMSWDDTSPGDEC